MKAVVFLADGFEEVEALTVVDYLRRVNIVVDTVSVSDSKQVEGAHGVTVMADKLPSELKNLHSYDAVVLPGGMPGSNNLRDSEFVLDTVKSLYNSNKLVAAICAAPIVLKRADIVDGKRITSYPGFEQELKGAVYIEEPVVVDSNIITARGPYFAVDFALEIVNYLLCEKRVSSLKKDILYT